MSRTLSYDFEISRKGGHIIVEGLSNAATVDRMKEVIDPKGWKLDNYRKNPTVLFDHGKDPAFGSMPIGKALACEITDGGLYTKIQLSNSKTEKLTAIRDLVEEGILKTFSVGFNPITSEKSANDPEVLVIKAAELIECSIVPIPMNQDSTFSVAAKSMKNICSFGREWLQNWLTKHELLKGRKYLAAALVQRMDDLIASKQFGSRKEIINLVRDSLKTTQAESLKAVLDVLDGSSDDSNVVTEFSKVLGLNKDFLKNLSGDNVLEQIRNLTETKAMEPAPKMVVHNVVVPKASADSLELAKELVEKAGFKSDQVAESEEAYTFLQNPADGLDMEKAQVQDLEGGLKVTVCPPKVSEAPSEAPAEQPKAETPVNTETAKAANVADQKNLDGTDDNPYHALARQTNVLLGTLINEVQKMSVKLDGMVDLSSKLAQLESTESETEETEAPENSEAKNIDLLSLFRKDLREVDTRLKRLNV